MRDLRGLHAHAGLAYRPRRFEISGRLFGTRASADRATFTAVGVAVGVGWTRF